MVKREEIIRYLRDRGFKMTAGIPKDVAKGPVWIDMTETRKPFRRVLLTSSLIDNYEVWTCGSARITTLEELKYFLENWDFLSHMWKKGREPRES